MKKIILAFFICIIARHSSAQSAFDKSINDVSAEMAEKLTKKNMKKIVVLYVTDVVKSQTVAGKYIADVLSVNIVNNNGNFEVFDRENLAGIAEAKNLMNEGYIDAGKAKELGKLLSVETIIVGNYTVLSKTLKLTLKVLDVNSGFVIAASTKDLPIDADGAKLLGIEFDPSGISADRGFNNRPLNSNEQYNNPSTVSSECEKNSTGDYCFANNTNEIVNVSITAFDPAPNVGYYNKFSTNLILKPKESKCLYNYPTKNTYSFAVFAPNSQNPNNPFDKGSLLVEKCKSKTYMIR